MKEIEQKLKVIDEMIQYNLRKGASAHSLARLRQEKKDLLRIHKGLKEERFREWYEVYMEDKRRGEGGGASESDANARTSLKQLMKDNRAQRTKLTQQEREDYFNELKAFEEEFGALPRLSRSMLSTSKVDSYTGEEIK